jgi:hypothetical protein
MRPKRQLWMIPAALLLLAGCATMPTGPTMLALPGTGKTFDAFRADDYVCREFAHEQVGGVTSQEAATHAGVASAAVGTAVGAAAGALLGGHEGVATGAGVGLLYGSAVGADAAESAGYTLQQRYDLSYLQCMYLKGDRIPVSGRFVTQYYVPQSAPAPPPPPGMPPPPPPGAVAPPR